MIEVTHRPLTRGERDLIGGLWSFLPWRARDREDLRAGMAEVITVALRRAWTRISCYGPPCCPNSYVFETNDGDVITFESWAFLHQDKGRLPGNRLRIVRLPGTKRVMGADVAGNPLDLSAFPDELDNGDMLGAGDCELFRREEVAAALAIFLDAAEQMDQPERAQPS